MTEIKPSSHGIVVEHKESGVRYAVSDKNYNSKVHRKVRDLKPGETVIGYQPRKAESLSDAVAPSGGTQSLGQLSEASSDGSKPVEDGSAGSGPSK